jgi:hypothetical protein
LAAYHFICLLADACFVLDKIYILLLWPIFAAGDIYEVFHLEKIRTVWP